MARGGIDTLTDKIRTKALWWAMKRISYARHRFPPDVIRHEIDDTDIVHRGDANCFSAAGDALRNGRSMDLAVQRYWNGEGESPAYPTPRVEILVTKARVVSTKQR
jgi:hypothetical protein